MPSSGLAELVRPAEHDIVVFTHNNVKEPVCLFFGVLIIYASDNLRTYLGKPNMVNIEDPHPLNFH